MKKTLTWTLTGLLLTGLFVLSPFTPVSAHSRDSHLQQDESPTETPSASAPTPAEVITAINNLRLSHGLNALTTNSILMQVAADQANALAGSEGAIGHERPCGMTLGQDFPAAGIRFSATYRSMGIVPKNWVAASTTEDAINFWLSDDLHTNTMLSPNRNDIGAAVAVSDQTYVVLETAWSTSSGQMQYDAYAILTGIPQTQTACYGMYTEAAKYGVSNQYSIPVWVSTALPNGDVIHEVKYGQSLWTLAIQYQTTIVEIKRLNRLYSDVISPGQKLLIKTGATQPAYGPGTPSSTPVPTRTFPWGDSSPVPVTSSPTANATSQLVGPSAGEFIQENSLVIFASVISFSVLLAGLGVVGKRK